MTVTQWLQMNFPIVLFSAFTVWIIAANKLPSIASWQSFLNSFESKGGQLLLLWVTDLIVLGALIHYWHTFDAQLQTTVVGLLSGINGAFLGAIGARNTGTPPPPAPTQLAGFAVPADKK